MSFYIGGTSVLIVVGVALDTLRQLEAQLHTQNYEGFLKKGRIRGRTAQ
jgi:preprotein translocase subunit SecY